MYGFGDDYGENVYNILIDIIRLNFKAQIKGSGIRFKKIFKMQNLETNKESYLLFLNDTSIWFDSQEGFIDEFISILQESLSELNDQFEDLNERRANQPFVDEYAVFLENEEIGVHGSKQQSLLKKMREFKAKDKKK